MADSKKLSFSKLPILKISHSFLGIKNGLKDDYSGFQSIITPPKHFSRQCNKKMQPNLKPSLIYHFDLYKYFYFNFSWLILRCHPSSNMLYFAWKTGLKKVKFPPYWMDWLWHIAAYILVQWHFSNIFCRFWLFLSSMLWYTDFWDSNNIQDI